MTKDKITHETNLAKIELAYRQAKIKADTDFKSSVANKAQDARVAKARKVRSIARANAKKMFKEALAKAKQAATLNPGTYKQFVKRYEPYDDKQSYPLPEHHYIWTVIEYGNKLRLVTGHHHVNRVRNVACHKPWTEADKNREYIYSPEALKQSTEAGVL